MNALSALLALVAATLAVVVAIELRAGPAAPDLAIPSPQQVIVVGPDGRRIVRTSFDPTLPPPAAPPAYGLGAPRFPGIAPAPSAGYGLPQSAGAAR